MFVCSYTIGCGEDQAAGSAAVNAVENVLCILQWADGPLVPMHKLQWPGEGSWFISEGPVVQKARAVQWNNGDS